MESSHQRYFYVGRSKDLKCRIREHRHLKVEGQEDKYEFIRQLEAAEVPWHEEVIDRVPDGGYSPDSERWHVIRLTREGHDLTNMRHGSVEHRKELAEQTQSRHIRCVADVRADQSRRKFQGSKRLRRKIWIADIKHRGVPDATAGSALPPVFTRKFLAQASASGIGSIRIDKGWTVSEFIDYVRKPLSGFRELRKLRDSLSIRIGSLSDCS
jgi:hypothetical protein